MDNYTLQYDSSNHKENDTSKSDVKRLAVQLVYLCLDIFKHKHLNRLKSKLIK